MVVQLVARLKKKRIASTITLNHCWHYLCRIVYSLKNFHLHSFLRIYISQSLYLQNIWFLVLSTFLKFKHLDFITFFITCKRNHSLTHEIFYSQNWCLLNIFKVHSHCSVDLNFIPVYGPKNIPLQYEHPCICPVIMDTGIPLFGGY